MTACSAELARLSRPVEFALLCAVENAPLVAAPVENWAQARSRLCVAVPARWALDHNLDPLCAGVAEAGRRVLDFLTTAVDGGFTRAGSPEFAGASCTYQDLPRSRAAGGRYRCAGW
jgi:hypothetical protein